MNTADKHILLIEDDSLLVEMYRLILSDEGFLVSVIKDGREALKKSLVNIDLVLLDIRLPEVGGLEILKSYRKRGFSKPIIVLTNNPQVEQSEAKTLGATDFLVKSHTDIKQVLNKVSSYFA